jgi:phosphopantothenoylcysteine synthetase/decarboxylase
MWKHPVRKGNLWKLKFFYNLFVVGPIKASVKKPLACGDSGIGKIADTGMIVDAVECAGISRIPMPIDWSL